MNRKIPYIYIVANTREQFKNESQLLDRVYNDHPSFESINYIIEELSKIGIKSEFFGGVEELVKAYVEKQKFQDALFLNLSDGLVHSNRKAQSAILLEMLEVPYIGSPPLPRLMANNKSYAKRIVSEKLTVPKGQVVFPQSAIIPQITFPVLVKPNHEGSSIGISQDSICTNPNDLQKQLKKTLPRFKEVLVEEYISGFEITCFIIGNRGKYYLTEPLMCEYEGIQYFNNFVFGTEEKANRKRKEYLASNFLNAAQVKTIKRATQTAFELLNMNDFARVDFRLQKNGRLVFIELNGNPVISETSELGVISRSLGIPFGNIIKYIILAALDRLTINYN